MIANLGKWCWDIIEAVGVYLVVFTLAAVAERRHPLETGQSKSAILLDYKLVFTSIVLSRAFAPISGVVAAMAISMAGGGLIPLRADGWWFPLSLAVLVFTLELQGYWYHRFQHSIPFFWSMHSLHHSAEAITLATGARHYWMEQAIISAFLPSVAMLFKIPHELARFLPYIFMTEYLAHMNIKVSFGPLMYVFNTPQYHRVHHSVDPRHYNKNFCKNLPIIDMIFGTAFMPGDDEVLPTGLTNQKPASLLEGILWPVRNTKIARRWLDPIPKPGTEASLPFEVS